jgi:hypothetical protein
MKYVTSTRNLPWARPEWSEQVEYDTLAEAREHFIREVDGVLSGGDPRMVYITEVNGRSFRSVAKAEMNG